MMCGGQAAADISRQVSTIFRRDKGSYEFVSMEDEWRALQSGHPWFERQIGSLAAVIDRGRAYRYAIREFWLIPRVGDQHGEAQAYQEAQGCIRGFIVMNRPDSATVLADFLFARTHAKTASGSRLCDPVKEYQRMAGELSRGRSDQVDPQTELSSIIKAFLEGDLGLSPNQSVQEAQQEAARAQVLAKEEDRARQAIAAAEARDIQARLKAPQPDYPLAVLMRRQDYGRTSAALTNLGRRRRHR